MTPQAVTASAIKQQRALKKKKLRKWGIIGAIVLVLGYGIYLLFIPYKGGMTFGVCKTFLEQQLAYPERARLSNVEDMGALIRIWYTQVDSFGEYRMESLSCTYRAANDADMKKYGTPLPFVLSKAVIGRRDIDAGVVEKFNYGIPAIVSSDLDLTLPSPLPDSLRDLQTDSNKFRKPLF